MSTAVATSLHVLPSGPLPDPDHAELCYMMSQHPPSPFRYIMLNVLLAISLTPVCALFNDYKRMGKAPYEGPPPSLGHLAKHQMKCSVVV